MAQTSGPGSELQRRHAPLSSYLYSVKGPGLYRLGIPLELEELARQLGWVLVHDAEPREELEELCCRRDDYILETG